MWKTCLASLLAIAVLSACGKLVPTLDEVLPDKRTEYKKSKSLPDLEVPPDLSTEAIRDRMAIPKTDDDGTATFSTYQERESIRKREEELQRSESGAIKLLANEHILAVEGVTTQIWPKLRQFWSGLGYDLELDDEELGVIETEWYENQQELIRDKFKVFAEPGQEPGTTLLYVSHRGEALISQGDKLVWQTRERDTDLERKVVERIQEELSGLVADENARTADSGVAGGSSEGVETGRRAEMVSAGGGKVFLALAEDYETAWESTGVALAQAGIQIERQNEARGAYVIRVPKDENESGKGVFSKLKFWGKDSSELQISLTGVGDKTEIVVLDDDGKWETSELAVRLLTRLGEEFNASGR